MTGLQPSALFFSSRRRHTSWPRDWSSDVCSSDLVGNGPAPTRVVYALTIPIVRVNRVGPMPAPTEAPPAVGFRSEERRVGKESRYERWLNEVKNSRRAEG